MTSMRKVLLGSAGMLALVEVTTSPLVPVTHHVCPAGRVSLQDLLSRQPIRLLAPHEHLYHEGDCKTHIYRIEQGLVRLYKLLNDGRRQIIAFRYPGDVLGSDTPTIQDCNAEAVNEVTIRSVSRQLTQRRMRDEPAVTSELFELLSKELADARTQIAVLNGRSAMEKIAGFILELWRRQLGCADKVTLDLTRTDIADFLGLAIETVSRSLTRLRKLRIIDLPEVNAILILDHERLEELANGEGENREMHRRTAQEGNASIIYLA